MFGFSLISLRVFPFSLLSLSWTRASSSFLLLLFSHGWILVRLFFSRSSRCRRRFHITIVALSPQICPFLTRFISPFKPTATVSSSSPRFIPPHLSTKQPSHRPIAPDLLTNSLLKCLLQQPVIPLQPQPDLVLFTFPSPIPDMHVFPRPDRPLQTNVLAFTSSPLAQACWKFPTKQPTIPVLTFWNFPDPFFSIIYSYSP